MFDDYVKRNAFNYFTQVAIRAGQHTLRVENQKNDMNQALDEAIKYRTDNFDEEAVERDDRYTTFNVERLD